MEAVMDDRAMTEITTHFEALSSLVPLHPIRTEEDYDKAVGVLNALLDAGASDESHPLVDLVATLGELIGDYDANHYPSKDLCPADTLRFIMAEHRLSQSDLPEIGTQGVVSEVLAGKRDLNVRQIKAISERFKINPLVFL